MRLQVGAKKRSAGSGSLPSHSPRVKRKRTPAEYYQSNLIEAKSKLHPARTPSSEKKLFYKKGSYLAVRNEHGLFYVCKTQQNVYKTTKAFKVQWLDLKKAPDLFEMSYYDTVAVGAVLTVVRFKKAKEKHLWMLFKKDIKRVETILGLAKKTEKDDCDSNMDCEEENEKDSDEDQISTSKAKTVLKKVVKDKKGRPPPKPSSAAKKVKKELTGKKGGRDRPRKTTATVVNTKAIKSKKQLSAPKRNVKLKKLKTLKKKEKKISKKKIHPNSLLTQRPDIEVVTKDPMFDVKSDSKEPLVSKFVLCKHLIRAVLTNDHVLLKTLVKDTGHVPSCFVFRSIDVKKDAMVYAIENNNKRAIKILTKEVSDTRVDERVDMPITPLEENPTGQYNFKTLGHAVRGISQGRGCREGNNAFIKECYVLEDYIGGGEVEYTLAEVYAIVAMSNDITFATYELLCEKLQKRFKEISYKEVHRAVKAGYRKLAAYVIKRCVQVGGKAFNHLHHEVLSCDKPEELSVFKLQACKRHPYDNDKITPLHCAAINPNPKILGKLLSVLPDYNLPDKKQNQLIHYAAACEGTGPLELLLGSVNPEQTNDRRVTPLMVAAMYGRLHNVEILLKSIEAGEKEPNQGVHHKDLSSYYPIHYAAEKGHMDCVKALAKHGADVDVITSAFRNKLTPLMLASRNGCTQTVKALVELGASIERKDKLKRSALTHAVMNGNYPVISYLLRKGADVNSTDSSGNTPTHYAAAYGWWHCLKLLFQAGGNPNQPNDWKIPPLGVALMKSHTGCVDLILNQPEVDLNFRDDSGSTLVMLTAATPMTRNKVEQMEYLVKKKGANVNLVDNDGQNAPVRNVTKQTKEGIKCSLEAAQILIDAGVNVTQLNKSGLSPVNTAFNTGKCIFELVAMLIKNGTTVSMGPNSSGQNVLHLMAQQCVDFNQAPILRVLAETLKSKDAPEPMEVNGDSRQKEDKKDNADPSSNHIKSNNFPASFKELASVADSNGYTPLLTCIATYAKRAESQPSPNALDMIQALIEVGETDVNVQTKTTAGLLSAMHLLANIEEQSITRQGHQLHSPGLKLLLRHKANINLKNKDGRTPLITSILAKKTMTAKFLIEAGADVNLASHNEKDDGKATPLILAARNNLHDVIPALLNKGANEQAKDCRNNMMALHYAAQSKDLVSDVVTSLKALLKSGINVNSVDNKGRTALHYAINAGSCGSDSSTEIIETLIERRANVFARDMYGRLPLHYVYMALDLINDMSQNDPIEMLTVVSEAMKGQQMNLQDKFGQTPLHGAALRGAIICCIYIVERVKDVDVRDRNQNTPLALAVMAQHISVVIMLIEKGASINTNVTRVPPELEKEEDEKQKEKKYRLWKPVQPLPPSPTVKSLLREIIDHEWQGVTFLAMDKLDRFQMSYANAVQGALEAHRYQLVLNMIRKQKNPQKLQVFNTRRRNLLHVLAINGMPTQGSELQVQVAGELIDRGLKLYMKDDRGCTPLHYAAVSQNLPLCKVFAEKDPDGLRNCITSQDLKGRVPMAALMWSYQHDDNTQDLIRLFSKYGGSLNIRSPLPKLDASTLHHMKKPESLEELYHSGQDKLVDLTPLSLMIYAQNWKALKFLVQNGADPNFTDKLELSPMMHAVKQNELDLVKVLCDHDYDPNKKNKHLEKTVQTFSSWAADIWERKKKPETSNIYAQSFDVEVDEDSLANSADKEKFTQTSNVNLTVVDSHGKSIIHHATKTCHHGTYENVALLELLVQLGAPTDLKDRNGQTPLDYFLRAGSSKMACALQRLMKVPEDNWIKPQPAKHVWSDGITWDFKVPDFNIDAKEMLKSLSLGEENKDVEQDCPPIAVVDPLSQLTEGGEVLLDPTQNIPYDVLMTKVDVSYGYYGKYSFYKMQVLNQKGKDMFLLFTRWGRIREEGQYQRTPFNSKEEAIKEFTNIFKSKTGNVWANLKSFHKEPKKYQLVKSNPWINKRKKVIKKFEFNLESKLPSKLPIAVQEVLKELTSIPMLNASLKKSEIDTAFWSFGGVSGIPKATLIKAKEILLRIRKSLEEIEALKQATFTDTDKHQTIMDKVVDMSNEFFELIPYYNFSPDKVYPLSNESQLSYMVVKLTNLLDLELTSRILMGAQKRIMDINPLDYVYRSLECQMQLLDENSTEAQLILQHIQNTRLDQHSNVNISSILRISRKGEEDRLASNNLDNHMLLWHGSNATNLISILKRGLLVAPPEFPTSGLTFGKGIYTADTFIKSLDYCNNYLVKSDTKFMLLCEVALGKLDEQKCNYTSKLRPGYDSIKGCGYIYPDPRHNLLLPSGATLSLGKLLRGAVHRQTLNYNEYIVYKAEQVCLRYLVVCKNE